MAGRLSVGRSVRGRGPGTRPRAVDATLLLFTSGTTAAPRSSGSRTWQVRGVDHTLPERARLDGGNSGIVLRLLTAVDASMARSSVGTRFLDSLGRRGKQELVEALRQFGARAEASAQTPGLPR